MHTQEIATRTLEMVAVAMSEEYGIKVVCNGQRAYTSYSQNTKKPVITIPSIPLTDDNYRSLLRGYVDHEVGHVRFTDAAYLSDALMNDLEIVGSLKTISSIYEDIYVERKMGESFPGCRRNLRKLGALIYMERHPVPVPARAVLENLREKRLTPQDVPYHLWTAVIQYILYRVRREALPKLERMLPAFQEPVDILAPGLAASLEPILARVSAQGVSTQANLDLARETLAIVKKYFFNFWEWPERRQAKIPQGVLEGLQWLMRNGGCATDTVDIGKSAENLIDQLLKDVDENLLKNNITNHHAYGSPLWKERVLSLSEEERMEALQAAAMMDAQMQALLQSFALNRSGPTKTGKLNTNSLYKLYTCANNVFYKNIDKRAINTEIVLCIDMSGSMAFYDKSVMASKSLFSVAHSLSKIRGIAFSIIGFFDNHVLDILRAGDRVSSRMKILPDGGTLCGAALKFAMQMLTNSRSSRKVVMMLTDGDANDGEDFEQAISRAKKDGVEFLGIGILDDHILRYLPQDECCVIGDLRQLATEILRMLRKKLGIAA